MLYTLVNAVHPPPMRKVRRPVIPCIQMVTGDLPVIRVHQENVYPYVAYKTSILFPPLYTSSLESRDHTPTLCMNWTGSNQPTS